MYMPTRTDFDKMERELRWRAIPIREMCQSAGIAQSTWNRWKNEDSLPQMRTWMRTVEAHQYLCNLHDTGEAAAP